jgi:hypothetical protein
LSRGLLPSVYVSLSVIRCNNNSLRLLQRVGTGGQAKKEIIQPRKSLVFCVKLKWSLKYKNVIFLFIIAQSNYTHTVYFFRIGVAIRVSQSTDREFIHACFSS